MCGSVLPGQVINDDPVFEYLEGYISVKFGCYLEDGKLMLYDSQKMRIKPSDIVPEGNLTKVLYS